MTRFVPGTRPTPTKPPNKPDMTCKTTPRKAAKTTTGINQVMTFNLNATL